MEPNEWKTKVMLNTLMNDLAKAIADVPLADCPAFIGELERMKAGLWARMMASENPTRRDQATNDRLLAVKEAAEKLGITEDYLYRHSSDLPFTVRLGTRHLRFSLNGIERYIRNRARR